MPPKIAVGLGWDSRGETPVDLNLYVIVMDEESGNIVCKVGGDSILPLYAGAVVHSGNDKAVCHHHRRRHIHHHYHCRRRHHVHRHRTIIVVILLYRRYHHYNHTTIAIATIAILIISIEALKNS